jgi:hypothetical protein
VGNNRPLHRKWGYTWWGHPGKPAAADVLPEMVLTWGYGVL